MRLSDVYGGQWLTADDLGGKPGPRVKVKIERYAVEKVGDKDKLILYFYGKEKGLALNVTNANVLKDAWGDEVDDWTGLSLVMRVERVNFQGKMVPAIRVEAASQRQEPPPRAEGDHGSYEDDPDFDVPF